MFPLEMQFFRKAFLQVLHYTAVYYFINTFFVSEVRQTSRGVGITVSPDTMKILQRCRE